MKKLFVFVILAILIGACGSSLGGKPQPVYEEEEIAYNSREIGEACKLHKHCISGKCYLDKCIRGLPEDYITPTPGPRTELTDEEIIDLVNWLQELYEAKERIRRVLWQDYSEGIIPASVLYELAGDVGELRYELSRQSFSKHKKISLGKSKGVVDPNRMAIYFMFSAELGFEWWQHTEWDREGAPGTITAKLPIDYSNGDLEGVNFWYSDDLESVVREVSLYYYGEPEIQVGDLKYANWSLDRARKIWFIAEEMFEKLRVVADGNTTEIASEVTAEPDWLIYENYILLFLFRYPPEGMLSSVNEMSSRMDLPREVDTNLKEKYLTVDLYYIDSNENALQDCLRDSARTDRRMIGENEFYILDEREGAAGTFYSWMKYSTANEKNCVSITYFTVSVNPDNYTPPLTAFDQQAEFEDFERIISTFEWTIE